MIILYGNTIKKKSLWKIWTDLELKVGCIKEEIFPEKLNDHFVRKYNKKSLWKILTDLELKVGCIKEEIAKKTLSF